MNTDSRHEQDDERPEAVRQAEVGAQAWRAVVHAQQAATPDHADFYNLAGNLVDTLAAVRSLVSVLHRQLGGYQDRLPPGRVVYDDSRYGAEPVDPRHRLADAGLDLDELTECVEDALGRANAFWSAIGHIGVEGVTS